MKFRERIMFACTGLLVCACIIVFVRYGTHQYLIRNLGWDNAWTRTVFTDNEDLQHYNPLIDEEVRHTWHLPEEWHLIAELPFGLPVQGPGDKDFKDLDTRVKVFK